MVNESGARSNKKLIPIHNWFAKYLENNLGKGGEANLNGKYYETPKTIIQKSG